MRTSTTMDLIHALHYAADEAIKTSDEWVSVPAALLLSAAQELKRLQALTGSLERQKHDLLIERAMP